MINKSSKVDLVKQDIKDNDIDLTETDIKNKSKYSEKHMSTCNLKKLHLNI